MSMILLEIGSISVAVVVDAMLLLLELAKFFSRLAAVPYRRGHVQIMTAVVWVW